MQKIVRSLRLLLPLLFVGFLILLAFSYTSNQRAERGEMQPVTSNLRGGERPELISYAFEDTQSLGGRVISRIRARRTMRFASGWYTLEDAYLTLYRKDGGTYELRAPQAQFHSETKEAEVSGGVKLTSSDGMEILTQEMKFDGNQLVNRIPVEFKVDQWKGRAGGIDLNLQHESMRLIEQVSATMQSASPSEPPVQLNAKEALFLRPKNEVSFYEHVTVRRGGETIRSNAMTLKFDQSRKVLVGLEGFGNVVINMTGSGGTIASGDAGSGEKVVNADRFFAEIAAGGRIQGFTAAGDNRPAHAMLSGPPRRDLSARAFRVGLDGEKVTDLRADFGVVLIEMTPKGQRKMTANQVIVAFDPGTRRASSAVANGGFQYTEENVRASAQNATFDIAHDRLLLIGAPGSQPLVSADGQTMKGNSIEIAPQGGVMKVNGNVVANLITRRGSTGSVSGTSIFPSSSSPVYVNADTAVLNRSAQTVTFKGSVKAWQETNTILTSELFVQGEGDLIQARNGVRMVLYNARSKTADKAPVFASGDTLTGRKSDRRLDLTGNVRMDEGGRSLTAEKANFFFNAARKLEKVEAHSAVELTEKASSRKGTANEAIYQVTEQMLFLNGSPAVVTDPQGSVKGEKIVLNIARNKVDVLRGSTASESTYNPQR